MWGSLNAAGVTFRLSGYRAFFGKDLKPESEDLEIAHGSITIPTTLPLSFITGFGMDYRSQRSNGDGGTTAALNGEPLPGFPFSNNLTSVGSSLALEDASIFMTSPMGSHFSVFFEFPMYETKSWEFTNTGKFQANNTNVPFASRNIQFATETPTFEVGKFWWNNLFGDALPRDSVNLLFGLTHLPLAYPTGKVRLSVNQYAIYERDPLELFSPRLVDNVVGGDPNDFLFRLSEPQVIFEVNGMLTFGKPVTDTEKRETFWAEYHVGVTNGSNSKADWNSSKDVYGRWVMRWYNQSLGFFGYYSPNTYQDTLTTGTGSLITAPNSGIMSGLSNTNMSIRFGPDMTVSLAPFGIPVWVENVIMFNKQSNPTEFNVPFNWFGGANQINWQPKKTFIMYSRYDWLRGRNYNDTLANVISPIGTVEHGITNSTPSEWDVVFGAQYLYEQNIKFTLEGRHHYFKDTSEPLTATLKDNGFTFRVSFGF